MADSETPMIAEFVGITGTSADQAKFYLEASNWNLKVAVARYYDPGDDSSGDQSDLPPQPTASENQPSRGASKQKPASRSKFVSSSDYFKADEDDDDDEAGQEFYAGGSEKSGQVVKGPPRKKDPSSIAKSVFNEAKAHGAEAVSPDEYEGQEAKMAAFAGSGYRLGDQEGPSSASDTSITGSASGNETKKVNMNIYFWANGFSIDDGPLRDPNDPANKKFLEEVSKGYVPSELMTIAQGKEVAVNLVDKRTEDYVKPKQKLKAFTGHGHMLGSPTPTVTSHTSSAAASSNQPAPTAAQSNVDDSQPTTSVTIRLSDGTRLVTKMNISSTVGDLRQFISRARPLPAGSKFNLMTTFPNKVLDDDSLTLEGGNLLNSVIVQRMV